VKKIKILRKIRFVILLISLAILIAMAFIASKGNDISIYAKIELILLISYYIINKYFEILVKNEINENRREKA
jgi:hypothetical protein